MSVLISAWAWKHPLSDPRAKLLLLKLADSANDDGYCWPSLATLSEHTGMPRVTLQRKMTLLIDLGLVERTERAGRSSYYQLKQPASSSEATPASSSEARTVKEPSVGETSNDVSLASTPKKRAPDVIWDTLEAIFGQAPAGKLARGAWNAAWRDLKADSATPTELQRACRLWPQRFSDATLTPPALAKHFRLLVPVQAHAPPVVTASLEERQRLQSEWLETHRRNGATDAASPT